jgi:hypothetical protein
MKTVTVALVALLVELSLSAAANTALAETIYKNCYWDGSPPFCHGSCPKNGDWVQTRSNDAKCLTGKAVECCQAYKSTTSDGSGSPYTANKCFGDNSCPKGYRDLDKPNKYGACCEIIPK